MKNIGTLKFKKARPSAKQSVRKRATENPSATLEEEVHAVLASLRRLGSQRIRNDMKSRYGIVGPTAERAFGVGMAAMQKIAKTIRGKDIARNHELAAALWNASGDGAGQYEARMVASLIDEPALVAAAQMDRWVKDFDNWAICDTVCFKLFDRVSPALAFRKVEQWSRKHDEFIKRAAFALLACLALHDKSIPPTNEPYLKFLPLIERAALDERNFVKKGVNWALRAIGRRNAALNSAAVVVAKRLAESPEPAARWVGKDALRDLTKPAAIRRLATE
jgi:3-methyladenine DNA glycosylase AlkD